MSETSHLQEDLEFYQRILTEGQTDELLNKIVNFRKGEVRMIDRYHASFLLQFLDRRRIERLQELFQGSRTELDVLQFVRFFLNVIEHDQTETIYLTVTLIDTFKMICQGKKDCEKISLLDLTNFFCQQIVEEDCSVKMPLRLLPVEKAINPDLNRVRKIDLEAPVVHQKSELLLPKIIKGKTKTDKTSHECGPVSEIVYSSQMDMLLTLDTLSPCLKIFDTSLNFKRQLIPQQSKSSKQLAILSFAYSRKQQRIGCIIKDIGMSFWQAADNFSTEKKIGRSAGDKIYYFQLFQQWSTTLNNITHFWDIKQEKIKSSLEGEQGSKINSICQIPVLRLLCVAYTGTDSQKRLVLYRQKQAICQLPLGRPGCHTVHYNSAAQVLIPIGYRISIPVYTVHPTYHDFTQVSELVGHSSLVTCIADIENSLICTGDDIGFIRVWELRTMKCIQVVKAARWLSHILYVKESKLIFTDSRVNLMNFESRAGTRLERQENLHPLSAHYYADGTIVLATRKDLRVYDGLPGKLDKVFHVVGQNEISAIAIASNGRILIGTDNGFIKIFTRAGEMVHTWKAHQNQVSNIRVDDKNKLVISSGWDSNVFIWRQGYKHVQNQSELDRLPTIHKDSYGAIRSLLDNHHGRQVCLMELNMHHNIIATASTQNELYIWDYEYGKLSAQLKLPKQPTSIAICQPYPLLFVGCADGLTYILQLQRKELKIRLKLLTVLKDSQYQFVTQSSDTNREPDLAISKIVLDINDKHSNVYLCQQKGIVSKYSIANLLISLTKTEDMTAKQNYNAYRSCSESFKNEYQRNQFQKLDCSNITVDSIAHDDLCTSLWVRQIHKDIIVSACIIHCPDSYLLSCSTDLYFKITNGTNGQQVCLYNVNHPLPLKWQLKIDMDMQIKQKVSNSLKVIHDIFKKYSTDISINESKVLSVKDFLGSIEVLEQTKLESQKAKAILLSEEYTPADLNPHYPRVTHKPTLKELQAYKRVYLSNGNRHNTQTLPVISQSSIFDTKTEDRETLARFLSPNHIKKLTQKGLEPEKPFIETPFLRNLRNILDGSQQASQGLSSKKPSKMQKESIDFVGHAISRHYLKENEKPRLNSLLESINEKVKEARRKYTNTHLPLGVPQNKRQSRSFAGNTAK